jgi:sorting nexin-9/18/33
VRSPQAEGKRLSDGSSSSTPRGPSPVRKDASDHPAPAIPLIPQTTGEWLRVLPSFRRSLLGGKSLNRFSSFVTSGAESFVLGGGGDAPAPAPVHTRHARDATGASMLAGPSEADMYEVDAGPSWKAKVPPFRVLVHSPSKVAGGFAPAYIVYSVTSLFHSDSPDEHEHHGHVRGGSAATVQEHEHLARITVPRRFSHFVALHAALLRALPGLALPPLPEKQYAGRFSADFVEARRGELEHYLARLVRHPVVRYAEVLTAFLSCESDAVSWARLLCAFSPDENVTGMEGRAAGALVPPAGRCQLLRTRVSSGIRHRRGRGEPGRDTLRCTHKSARSWGSRTPNRVRTGKGGADWYARLPPV